MPISLPQLSRREFLRCSTVAGVAMALAPSSCTGLTGKARDKHTMAFFSDTHIAAEAGAVKDGVNMAANLATCVRDLTAWPVNPAVLIVTGDLALKDGRPGDYATFGRLIEPARALAPVCLTLGNHDQRDNFWQAFPRDVQRQKSVPHRQCAVMDSPRANWFLLDSLEVTNKTPGDLGAAQFYWLSRELSARLDKPAIIVVHHNLNELGGIIGLKDSAALEELFVKFPQIKAFIFGHTHNWEVSRHPTGVHLINLPPTSYVFKAGRPNGWVRCTLARDGAEFELRALDVKHPEHAQVRQLQWRI